MSCIVVDVEESLLSPQFTLRVTIPPLNIADAVCAIIRAAKKKHEALLADPSVLELVRITSSTVEDAMRNPQIVAKLAQLALERGLDIDSVLSLEDKKQIMELMLPYASSELVDLDKLKSDYPIVLREALSVVALEMFEAIEGLGRQKMKKKFMQH